MPVADYKTYCRMIDHALEKKFAYPAINVTSRPAANGVLKGPTEPERRDRPGLDCKGRPSPPD